MQALIIREPGKAEIVQVEMPIPKENEVLLRIGRSGFCGSDLSTFRGLNPLVSYPRIPGHELGATIVRTGCNVPGHLKAGCSVLVLPYSHCGNCTSCRQGRFNACRANQTLGVQRDGGIAEFLALPWEKVMMAPGLSLQELALVEPLTVGFHAIARGRVQATDTVAVFGCGAIGLGAIAGAAARGARVIAVDIDEAKLMLARKAGATSVIHSQKENLHRRLQELSNEDGPDVIVEAIGLPSTFRAAVEEVCFAGRVVYIGYAKAPVEYETKHFVQKELDILGSRNAAPSDFEAVIHLLQSRRFPVDGMVSRVVSLDEAPKALKEWSANPSQISKIQIEMPIGPTSNLFHA